MIFRLAAADAVLASRGAGLSLVRAEHGGRPGSRAAAAVSAACADSESTSGDCCELALVGVVATEALGLAREGAVAGVVGSKVAVAGLSTGLDAAPSGVVGATLVTAGLGLGNDCVAAGLAGVGSCDVEARRALFTLARIDILPAGTTWRRISCLELTRAPLSVTK